MTPDAFLKKLGEELSTKDEAALVKLIAERVSAPQAPTPERIESFKQLASLYNAEESSFWARNNILGAVQGVMIAGMAASWDKVPAGGHVVFACLGFAAAFGWLLMVRRSVYITHVLMTQLSIIEGEIFRDSWKFRAFSFFDLALVTGKAFEDAKGSIPNESSDALVKLRGLTRWPRLSSTWTCIVLAYLVVWIVTGTWSFVCGCIK